MEDAETAWGNNANNMIYYYKEFWTRLRFWDIVSFLFLFSARTSLNCSFRISFANVMEAHWCSLSRASFVLEGLWRPSMRTVGTREVKLSKGSLCGSSFAGDMGKRRGSALEQERLFWQRDNFLGGFSVSYSVEIRMESNSKRSWDVETDPQQNMWVHLRMACFKKPLLMSEPCKINKPNNTKIDGKKRWNWNEKKKGGLSRPL